LTSLTGKKAGLVFVGNLKAGVFAAEINIYMISLLAHTFCHTGMS